MARERPKKQPQQDKTPIQDNKPDALTFQNLAAKPNLIKVISDYYTARDGEDFLKSAHTPAQVAQYFITDRTWKDMNTYSVGKELKYVWDDDTSDEQKQRLAVVRKAWDKLPSRWEDGGRGWDDLGESFSALVADPANLIGLGLGGAISKFGLKAAASLGLTAAVDAGVNAGVELAQQQVEKEVGMRDATDIGRVGAAAAIGAAPTFVAAGAGKAFRKVFVDEADAIGGGVMTNIRRGSAAAESAAPSNNTVGRTYRAYDPDNPSTHIAPQVDMAPDEALARMAQGPRMVPDPIAVNSSNAARMDSAPNFRPDSIINDPSMINNPESLERFMQEIADHPDTQQFIKSRVPSGGKKVTDAQLRTFADSVGFDLDFLKNRTNAIDVHTIVVAKRALETTLYHSRALAKDAVNDPTNIEKLVKFRNALNVAAAVQYRVAGMSAQAGRALRAFRTDVDFGSNATTGKLSQTVTGLSEAIDSVTSKGLPRLIDLAAHISAMSDPQLARFARAQTKASTSDKLIEAYKSALLWNPKTQFVNTLSNFLTAQNRLLVEDPLAQGVGRVREGVNKLLGQQGERASRGNTAAIFGWWNGTRDATRVMSNIFMTDGIYGQARLDTPVLHAIPGKTGAVIRLPMRVLNSVDAFFKVTAERAYISKHAMDTALSEGLQGNALKQRVTDLINNPSEEMTKGATAFAEELTYQTDLGKAGKALQRLVDATGLPAHMVIPFIRTPINLTKYALKRAPGMEPAYRGLQAAWGSEAAKKAFQGRNLDQMIARQLQGAAIASAVVAGVEAGILTGSNEESVGNAKGSDLERLRSSATGSQPFSAKIGDVYYSYNTFDPFAQLVGLVADLKVAADRLDQSGKNMLGEEFAFAAMMATRNLLISKTWAQGVEDMFKAIEDPEWKLPQFLQNRIVSAIPTVMAHAARTADTTVRVPSKDDFLKGLYDAVASRTPGKTGEVFPMIDVFGEIVERRAGPLDFTSADAYGFTTRQAKNDPFKREVLNLVENFNMPPPRGAPASVMGYTLTSEERNVYAYVKGQTYYATLAAYLSQPGYTQASPAEKITIVKEAEKFANDRAHYYMIANYPEYMKGVDWGAAEKRWRNNIPKAVEEDLRQNPYYGVRPRGIEK